MKQSKHTAPSSQYNSANKPFRQKTNIKTVQVFIDDLDSHIEQSYRKLRVQREITHKQQTANFSSIGNIGRKPKQYQQKMEIPLIDNRKVLEYINYVYEIYNIADPLAENYDKQQSLEFTTNKKGKLNKGMIDSKNDSASTAKNYRVCSPIEVTPFSERKKSLVIPRCESRAENKMGDQIKKGIVITLRPKSSMQRLDSQKKLSEPNNVTSGHLKRQSSFKSTQHSQIREQFSLNRGNDQIKQLFRYCFMCEQPILQSNLQSHEKVCHQLQEAFNYDMQTICNMLDSKISKLLTEVDQKLISKDEAKIGQQFNTIKQSVKKWIQVLPLKKQNTQNNSNSLLERRKSDWRCQFKELQGYINSTVCGWLQALSKLHWFCRLRQNISSHYCSRR